jgi:hypothetical protein
MNKPTICIAERHRAHGLAEFFDQLVERHFFDPGVLQGFVFQL